MAYETEEQEVARVAQERAEFEAAAKKSAEKREADLATKYSDGGIRSLIRESMSEYGIPERRLVAATTAQAMIAYNNMIDKRWKNA